MKLPLNCDVDYLDTFLESSLAHDLFNDLMGLIKNSSFLPQTEVGIVYDVNFGKILFIDQDLLDDNRFPEEHWGPTKP